MERFKGILIIGTVEILTGAVTLAATLGSLALVINTKTPNVLFFVIVASLTSSLIGLGLLKFRKIAYQLLLYFSSVVILSKILIFMGILELNGALAAGIPESLKNIISILYHGFVIYYLQKPEVKELFHK